jgi:hypothetical protein
VLPITMGKMPIGRDKQDACLPFRSLRARSLNDRLSCNASTRATLGGLAE